MVHYCYKIQAWIVNGFVAECGHLEKQANDVICYSCHHAGQVHHTCEGCETEVREHVA